VRSVLYRFPELDELERTAQGAAAELELALPAGETAEDGEWVLAIFELGPTRRATSAAGRASVSPDGARLVFEPRDLRRMVQFAAAEALLPPPGAVDPADVEPRTARSPTGSAPTLERSRILIVDDDPDIRDVVSVMLQAVGLAVVAVESGELALDRARAEPFDLMVLDWNLPKMNGLDVCRTLRKDPALAVLPVLFLTANASSQDMVEAFASGGDDYVVKPFRAPELGARIFSLLRRARKVA
jgi:two-component system phosphate regulon response regulator PhoB